jgi:hypothetical protein
VWSVASAERKEFQSFRGKKGRGRAGEGLRVLEGSSDQRSSGTN